MIAMMEEQKMSHRSAKRLMIPMLPGTVLLNIAYLLVISIYHKLALRSIKKQSKVHYKFAYRKLQPERIARNLVGFVKTLGNSRDLLKPRCLSAAMIDIIIMLAKNDFVDFMVQSIHVQVC